jgi:TrmH family RNA methyltransferase
VDAAVISSRHNPLIRELRATLRESSRRSGVCVVEGWKLLDAAAAAGLSLDLLLVTERAAADEAGRAARARVAARAAREVTVTADVFAALTQVESPQGVLALIPRPSPAPPVPADPEALAVVLDGVQDPGNVGAIVRTAVACRAAVVIPCGASADPFGPKALRASAGAAFHVPVAVPLDAAAAAAALRAGGLRLVVADAHAAAAAGPGTWSRPLALVLGGEAAGPSAAWCAQGGTAVRVPVLGPVESLNVAAAAAVLLYQAAGVVRPCP